MLGVAQEGEGAGIWKIPLASEGLSCQPSEGSWCPLPCCQVPPDVMGTKSAVPGSLVLQG